MFNKLKEFPVILYSLFAIIWGIYKFKYYNHRIFIFLIILFFIIMLLNNILIITPIVNKLFKYIVSSTVHFERIFIVLMILYLMAAIVINILNFFKIFDENALFPMEAISFILLGCSISGYNCYIYTKELRKKHKQN